MTAVNVAEARKVFGELTKPGSHTDHDETSEAGQKVTLARFAHYKETQEVLPKSYPPPPAGDGKDVFDMADEAGEGEVTYKEIAKFIGRNQNLKNRLQQGWEWFTQQFSIENLQDCPLEKFKAIWAEAAAMRAKAEAEA